jgi:excisionase family DNA binding protein
VEISIAEAAEKWGVSRQYIYRKIKSGGLSKLNTGTIDTSELLRVFGEPKNQPKSKGDSNLLTTADTRLQQENTLLRDQIRRLEGSLSHAEQLQSRLLSQIEDANQKVQLLIEYQAPKDAQKGNTSKQIINWVVIILIILVTSGVGLALYLRSAHYF